MVIMEGSDRSPARKSASKLRSPPRFPHLGDAFVLRIVLADGSQGRRSGEHGLILYSSIKRQKAEASGVPTAFPLIKHRGRASQEWAI